VYSSDASFILAFIELAIDVESYVVYAVKEEKKVIEASADNLELLRENFYTARPILERWRDDCAQMGI